MARYEGELIAAGEASIDLGELRKALVSRIGDDTVERRAAMARLLSATEGWKAAAASLDGAFAHSLGVAGLTPGKEK